MIKLTESQVDKCRGEGFIPMPKQVKVDRDNTYYVCPFCDSSDHYATVSNFGPQFGARPIHCYHSGRMAWVDVGDHIVSVIQSEEQKFMALLDKFQDVKEMSAEDACVSWHSKGMPLEIAEEVATDKKRFKELVAEHRAKSGNNFKTVY